MCNSQKKPGPQLLGHLICLFTLIINIYGLEVGISTIKKFTSVRGWGIIFMIRVTRKIKCLIAQAQGVIPHPLPEVNFIMVKIPTPKP
jgi:hypothetical protein